MRVWFLDLPRWFIGLGYGLFGVAALAMALVAEYVFGSQPCILCLWQRLPYLLIAVLGFSAFIRSHEPKDFMVFLGLMALAFLFGGSIAVYQVGGEEGWWLLTESCRGQNFSADMTTEEIIAQIRSQKQAVPCDVVTWSMFGISFAGWNAIISVIAFFKTIWFMFLVRKEIS